MLGVNHGPGLFKVCLTSLLFFFQLSSECADKLFHVKFYVLKMKSFPFFEALTPPIRCILKTCDNKISTITWKKLPSGVHLFNGSSFPQCGVGLSELQQKAVCEAIPSPPSKKKKLGRDTPLPVIKAASYAQRPDEECSSHALSATKVLRFSLIALLLFISFSSLFESFFSLKVYFALLVQHN